MKEPTFTFTRMVEAYTRGYRVTDCGKLLGPLSLRNGPLSIKCYGKQRYPTFSTNWGGRVFGVPVHQFAAFCFYGQEILNPSLVVRHKNGNTLDVSKENIILGTHSENAMDKDPLVRKAAAVKARAAQPKRAVNAKLTGEQVKYIREYLDVYKGKKSPNGYLSALVAKMSVSNATLWKIRKGDIYSE